MHSSSFTDTLPDGVGITGALPKEPENKVLFILHENTSTERSLLDAFMTSVERQLGSTHQIHRARTIEGNKGDGLQHEDLTDALTDTDRLTIVPVGVAWKPKNPESQTWRETRAWMATLRNGGRQRSIIRKSPERCTLVIGEAGSGASLFARFKRGARYDDRVTGAPRAFADYVALQAGLTIERDSRSVTGATLKYPRLVKTAIWARPEFQEALEQLAKETGANIESVRAEAKDCLKELIPKVRAPHVSMTQSLSRFLCRLGYDDRIHYDEERMKEIRALALTKPTVLVWTHKTHVDGMAMVVATGEEGFPLVHMIGGNNMAFAGIGYLFRRAGTVFIRRNMQDSPVYKVVLRFYLTFLLEKRFPISWALEGTRSRNGKLMPPRFGILKYAVEAAARNNVTDLHVIPMSIYYDLIAELSDYAAEQTGGTKRPESLMWFTDYVRSLRKPLGRISIGLGDPIVVDTTSQVFEDALNDDSNQFSVELQKIAFDASVKANAVTPITPSALLSLCLTGATPQALTDDEFDAEMIELIEWARKRNLPMTEELRDYEIDEYEERIRDVARAMIDMGVVDRYDGGPERVYSIAPGQHFAASYYRNTCIHFFVEKAIIELALAKAAESPGSEAVYTFWQEAVRLRDTFKYEFFYPETDEFNEEVRAEIERYDPQWEQTLAMGGAQKLLRSLTPLVSHAVLRPFAEAYVVVADVLLNAEATDAHDEKTVVNAALTLGRQSFLQRRITSEESIGKLMFSNGHKLAANRGLMDKGLSDPKGARVAFARELKDIAERIRRVDEIAANRRRSADIGVRGVAVDNEAKKAAN